MSLLQVDTFQALAEWLEVALETRLISYAAWDHRDRGGLIVQVSRSAHYVDLPYEFEMDLMTAEEVSDIAERESDEVYWQMMKHLELDLEAKRCIPPVFAKRYLETPSYSTLVTAFKLAKRFLVGSDQTAFSVFKRIGEWFKLSHEQRKAMCATWMVSFDDANP